MTNPANYDIPDNNCDDDGDGRVDNPPTCDTGLSLIGSAEEFARAIGICEKASERGYGLVSATFTRGYQRTDPPMDEQHGVLAKFGDVIRPREGTVLGVLSTGYAREYDGDGMAPFGGTVLGLPPKDNGKDWYGYGEADSKPGNGTAPPRFPKSANGCNQGSTVNDVVSLKLELKAPPNAAAFRFDLNFFSGEWPAYVCSPYNDGFIAYLSAKSFNNGEADNVAYDQAQNPISVNNSFFDRCTPNTLTGCAKSAQKQEVAACAAGAAELGGTGFGIEGEWCAPFGKGNAKSVNGGSTGWLTTRAPIQPGETFTLELMIWDVGDALFDSSILLDKFVWAQGTDLPATERPVK